MDGGKTWRARGSSPASYGGGSTTTNNENSLHTNLIISSVFPFPLPFSRLPLPCLRLAFPTEEENGITQTPHGRTCATVAPRGKGGRCHANAVGQRPGP